jgi:16S rRNA (guanine966-N2)-methyltransferase
VTGAPGRRPRAAAGGSIRIIGGLLRNSRLEVPLSPGLRPTPDRVRETLFNWLMNHVGGARCLDLFAGTGALGLEALSRGARETVFVERDPALAAALKANLQRLRQQEKSRVINADAATALAQESEAFDLVFLDPPFGAGLWTATAQALEARGLLRPGALAYVESPRAEALQLPASWQLHREGVAGDVRHALYRRDAGMA